MVRRETFVKGKPVSDWKKLEYSHKRINWTTYPEVCKSCGLCVEKCPVKCLSFDSENVEYLGLPAIKCDIEKCIACGTCESVCPDSAIRIEGKR